MKKLLWLCLLACSTALGQTYPTVAMSAQNPSGQFVNVSMDSNGNLYTNGSGSTTAAAALAGYVPPAALTAQGPSGQQVYLQADANGNLYTNNTCPGCTVFPQIVGTNYFATGLTTTNNFKQTIISNAPAGFYSMCPALSVTATTLSAGSVAVLWGTSKDWATNGTQQHTIFGSQTLTTITDAPSPCSNFYSQAGATIGVYLNFTGIGTGSVTYNVATVLTRLM